MDISAYQHINIRMSTRGKRPLRNLTPSDKVRAIQRIHNGETKASVSRDIGVPESTLRGWCKNEQKLRFMCHQLGGDAIPISSVLEKPPEKRIKFDTTNMGSTKFQAIPKFASFPYNSLPLNGADLSNTTGLNSFNPNISAFVDNIAFEEFVKKNALQAEANKQFALSSNLQFQLPIQTTDNPVSQLSVMQNLNLLSFLTPMSSNVSTSSTTSSESHIDCNITTTQSRTVTNNSNEYKDSIIGKRNEFALSVKEWAKEPCAKYGSHIGVGRQTNDSNNNDLKAKRPNLSNKQSEKNNSAIMSLPSPPIPTIPNLTVDVENTNNNNAVLEWCKVFNASLNFLALAAAAAALQPPQSHNLSKEYSPQDLVKTESHTENTASGEKILLTELTKTILPPTLNSPTSSYIHCDASNDSFYDSEPEDLSIRSTASKLSSPVNSRSQSPAKSSTSSCSAQSDADQ